MMVNGGIENSGIINVQGFTSVEGAAVGSGASIRSGASMAPVAAESESSCDVAVVTVLAVEAMAITHELGLYGRQHNGRHVDVGTVTTPGSAVDVVAARTLVQGQRSVGPTFEFLRREFNPKTVVLAGIAGSIHSNVKIGDVVIGTSVVYYDLRKVTPEGTVYRGSAINAPADSGHAVNAFFSACGEEPATLHSPRGQPVLVHSGPIGSGEAVVADSRSGILGFLRSFNDKTMAVEMEAGGLSQCVEEISAMDSCRPGWVVVRGISDLADEHKRDDHPPEAAMNAALAVRHLLPFLQSKSGRKQTRKL